MSVRKAGLVAAGALAALFAASPLASAAPSLPELPAGSAVAPNPCSFDATGDDATENGSVDQDNPINTVVQAPLGGDNIGKIGECSTYGQHNNEGNGEGNILNGEPVSFPSLP